MYRYYRLYIKNIYGGTCVIVSELEFLYKGVDLTDGLPQNRFSASSIYSSGYGAYRAFDNVWGENNGGWQSRAGATTNQWLKVDFGTPVKIDSINYEADKLNNYTYGIKDYVLQGSNDDLNWTDIIEGTYSNSGGNQTTPLVLNKFIFKNYSNETYYTIDVNTNEIIQLNDNSAETISSQGVSNGTSIDLLNIRDFYATVGETFDILSLSDSNSVDVTIEHLHSDRKLTTSPEVLLLGVETIDSIVANSTSSPLTAISFDNGSSWISYDNGNWITVENAHQGMSIATLNSIPSEALTRIRGEANYIKFQHSFGNNDNINSFKMYVSFKGTNGILDTAYYSFDYSAGQLDVTLKKQGNYSIVYTDVEV